MYLIDFYVLQRRAADSGSHGNSSFSTFNGSRPDQKECQHAALLFQKNSEIPAYQVSGLDFIQAQSVNMNWITFWFPLITFRGSLQNNKVNSLSGLSAGNSTKCLVVTRMNKSSGHSAASTISVVRYHLWICLSSAVILKQASHRYRVALMSHSWTLESVLNGSSAQGFGWLSATWLNKGLFLKCIQDCIFILIQTSKVKC